MKNLKTASKCDFASKYIAAIVIDYFFAEATLLYHILNMSKETEGENIVEFPC